MQPVAIKIKKESVRPEGALSAQPPEAPAPISKKSRPNKLFFWLLAVAVLILAAAVFLFPKPALPYQDLVAADARGVFYFNEEWLSASLKAMAESGYAWPPFVWLKDNWQKWLADNKLEIKQIAPLFEPQMVLVWLPSSNGRFDWLLLASKKVSDSVFESVLSQTEKELKQNYNLISEIYRQTTITEIKSLSQNQSSLYYAQIKNYFLISNSADSLKGTIDKIIGR